MYSRIPLLLALAAVISAPWAGASEPDPAFTSIPFERWLAERDQAHFQWRVHVDAPQLAPSQRLCARVEVSVDGREVLKRQGTGELAFFIQFRDRQGGVYQVHGAIGLREVREGAAQSNFVYTQDALVLPGDYRVDIAILDTHTGEHATAQKDLHVAPLHGDPFPDSWRGLPTVVLLNTSEDPPDAWYRPEVPGTLRLSVQTRRPLRVDVLLNVWPVPENPRRRAPQATNRSLADLLPALKVLSQVRFSQGAMDVSVLDLSRRKVVFTQGGVDAGGQSLSWDRLRPALLQADPNTISVGDLAGSGQSAQFLVNQVSRRLESQPPAALILLSAPLQFGDRQDLHPIAVSGRPDVPVFIFRFHAVGLLSPRLAMPSGIAGPRQMPRIWRGTASPPLADELPPLLKPLHPRVFDIYVPMDFRKALAEVLRELARLQ